MKNKTVIVTGSSSGMGKFMAMKFAQEGANVVITGRSLERLEKAKEEMMETSTGDIFMFPMDVRKPEDVERMVKETVDKYGSMDHLVNNAGGNFVCAAEDRSVNGWKLVNGMGLNGSDIVYNVVC